jgi:hypothetical protein
VPFFVLPLLMTFDMAGRVTGYMRAATATAEAKKRLRTPPYVGLR